MPLIPSEQELRDMVKEGKTLYQISRKFDMVIKEVFKLGRSYGISFDYYHNHIPKPTKQDLESMYHDEHLTQYQISREFNVAESTVQWWLRNYNIQCTVPIPPKEVLERMYIKECMNQKQIASKFNVTYQIVGIWLRKYRIPIRGRGVPIPPKEVLERMYIKEGMTLKQIAKEFNVAVTTVSKWLHNYNIQIRKKGAIAFPIPPKDDLLKYIAEGLNQLQIAEKYEVSDWKIYDWCEQLGIPGMVNNFRCTTPEHINWRDKVFARDNYICQECGSQYELQAHHIVPYCDYPEVGYELENGITLCKQCHESIRWREYEYIEQFAAITQRP